MDGRARELLSMVERAVSESAGGGGAAAGGAGEAQGPVGVAFSGGVDSSLIAAVCSRLRLGPVLLTVGFAGSHDVRFAAAAARRAGLAHRTLLIGGTDAEGGSGVRDRGRAPPPFARIAAEAVAATGGGDPSRTENCIAFYYIGWLARSLRLRTVLTGNGIDELFCGYDSYRRALAAAGVPDGDAEAARAVVEPMVGERVSRELSIMSAAGRFAGRLGVRVAQPLLSAPFVAYAGRLPIESKIAGPGDLLRKHAVRSLAASLGVAPHSAGKRKKAIQYGSRIHAELLRSGALPPAPPRPAPEPEPVPVPDPDPAAA